MENKEQLIKELELFLAKLKESNEPKIDFSILNDEDVFYLKTDKNYRSLFVGKDPFKSEVYGYNINSIRCFHNSLCNKDDVIELRKATDEEIALYRKYYPTKQKIWIEVFKWKNGNIGTITSFTETRHIENLQITLDLGGTTLEVIEKEY